jgi:short-subunit dehydrogenase
MPLRVAVITGAANGLGKAMALGLLGRSFAVVAVDRDGGGLEALRSPLPEAHVPNLATVAADLTQFDAAQLSLSHRAVRTCRHPDQQRRHRPGPSETRLPH